MREKIEDRKYIKQQVKKRLLEETKGRCAHCGAVLIKGENQTLEHFIPLNKGGRNEEDNFTMLCYDCNQLKSDMILPVSWYPYLSKTKKNTFKSLIRRYLTEIDYVAEDCVMMIDAFRIRVFVPVQKKLGSNSYKTFSRPIDINMLKMTWYDAFDWLMEYRTSLELRDAYGTIKEPREWTAPCYMLKKGDTEIAMVNPWIRHEWNEEMGNYFNEILFDWYFSPKLPDEDYMPKTLKSVVIAVENYVLSDLQQTIDGATAIVVSFRYFVSDRFCDPVFDKIERSSAVLEFDTQYHMPARIRQLSLLQYVGENKASKEIYDAVQSKIKGVSSVDEVIKIAMNYCDAFNKRFKDKEG